MLKIKFLIAVMFLSFQLSSLAWGSGFAADMGFTVSGGTVSDKLGTIPGRTMVNGSAFLETGWHIKFVSPLIFGEYRYSGQTTDETTVENQNMGGSGYLFGVGLRLDFRKYFLSGYFDFSGAYKLAKTTPSGDDSVYSSPRGFHVWLGKKLTANTKWFLSFSEVSYSQSSIFGELVENKLTQLSYGVGILIPFH